MTTNTSHPFSNHVDTQPNPSHFSSRVRILTLITLGASLCTGQEGSPCQALVVWRQSQEKGMPIPLHSINDQQQGHGYSIGVVLVEQETGTMTLSGPAMDLLEEHYGLDHHTAPTSQLLQRVVSSVLFLSLTRPRPSSQPPSLFKGKKQHLFLVIDL